MSLFEDVGGFEGFVRTLDNLSAPPDVIEDLIKVLHTESTSLEGGEPTEVAPDVFGGRFSAENLAQHTRLAHQYLANSVLEAVASLQDSGDAVKHFHEHLLEIDGASHAATTALINETQQAVNLLDDNRHTQP